VIDYAKIMEFNQKHINILHFYHTYVKTILIYLHNLSQGGKHVHLYEPYKNILYHQISLKFMIIANLLVILLSSELII